MDFDGGGMCGRGCLMVVASFNGGGDVQWQGSGAKKRHNTQIDYGKDNKGRSKESGGCIRGQWDAVVSVIGQQQQRRRGGGSALDDGARVIGVCLFPQRSTPGGNRGRSVQKPEAKIYACGQSIIHGGEDRQKELQKPKIGTNY